MDDESDKGTIIKRAEIKLLSQLARGTRSGLSLDIDGDLRETFYACLHHNEERFFDMMRQHSTKISSVAVGVPPGCTSAESIDSFCQGARKVLRGLPNLEELRFTCRSSNDYKAFAGLMAEVPNISKLAIHIHTIEQPTQCADEALAGHMNLESVSFHIYAVKYGGNPPDNPLPTSLNTMPNLTSIEIYNCRANQFMIEGLSTYQPIFNIPNITRLHLKGMRFHENEENSLCSAIYSQTLALLNIFDCEFVESKALTQKLKETSALNSFGFTQDNWYKDIAKIVRNNKGIVALSIHTKLRIASNDDIYTAWAYDQLDERDASASFLWILFALSVHGKSLKKLDLTIDVDWDDYLWQGFLQYLEVSSLEALIFKLESRKYFYSICASVAALPNLKELEMHLDLDYEEFIKGMEAIITQNKVLESVQVKLHFRELPKSFSGCFPLLEGTKLKRFIIEKYEGGEAKLSVAEGAAVLKGLQRNYELHDLPFNVIPAEGESQQDADHIVSDCTSILLGNRHGRGSLRGKYFSELKAVDFLANIADDQNCIYFSLRSFPQVFKCKQCSRNNNASGIKRRREEGSV